jgi:NADH-quinone oxidoreductase subunit H
VSLFNYSLFHLLVFPGLLFAVPAAWFFMWVERKSIALMQQRVGPPFMQPYYDFMKLMGKQSPVLPGFAGTLMKAWPALAVMTLLASLALLPTAPHGIGFAGDLILLATLLELPSIFSIIAGFTSKSLFGEVGSAREAVLGVANSILFLTALVMIALSAHTFRLSEIATAAPTPMRVLGIIAILACIPAKLRLNPFSTANAEQEIYAGALTEYAGPDLAFWELAHGLEWMALTGLVACIAVPQSGNLVLDICSFVLTSFLLVLVFAAISAGTARLTLNYSVRLYCTWGLVLIVLGFSSALLMRIKL